MKTDHDSACRAGAACVRRILFAALVERDQRSWYSLICRTGKQRSSNSLSALRENTGNTGFKAQGTCSQSLAVVGQTYAYEWIRRSFKRRMGSVGSMRNMGLVRRDLLRRGGVVVSGW